jgi:hypothetical protein
VRETAGLERAEERASARHRVVETVDRLAAEGGREPDRRGVGVGVGRAGILDEKGAVGEVPDAGLGRGQRRARQKK